MVPVDTALVMTFWLFEVHPDLTTVAFDAVTGSTTTRRPLLSSENPWFVTAHYLSSGFPVPSVWVPFFRRCALERADSGMRGKWRRPRCRWRSADGVGVGFDAELVECRSPG